MKILLIAAHPDDEILGCGATVGRLAKEGCQVHTLLLGHGVDARHSDNKDKGIQTKIEALKKQARKSNQILGVEDVFIHDFADNKFDTVALLDIVKVIEKVVDDIQPDIVFTHYEKDLNIDHRIVYQATIIATRPVAGQSVKEIYSFEVLSSTEWNYPLSFSPDTFFDVSATMDLKLKALECYESEMKDSTHPRSIEAVKLNAELWGTKVGFKYAEAFKCVRCLK